MDVGEEAAAKNSALPADEKILSERFAADDMCMFRRTHLRMPLTVKLCKDMHLDRNWVGNIFESMSSRLTQRGPRSQNLRDRDLPPAHPALNQILVLHQLDFLPNPSPSQCTVAPAKTIPA